MLDNCNFLFVGGAPRSGTTLTVNLLDWHPELVVFPVEHEVFRKYWLVPPEDRKSYFRETFLEPNQGQQALMANVEAAKQKEEKLRREFGTDFTLGVTNESAAKFRQEYCAELERGGPGLESILHSLSAALIQSHAPLEQHLETPKYQVFKHPYFTELYAAETANLIPGAKFIHLVRHPAARYLSAKRLRIRKDRFGRTMSARINGVNFTAGHTEVSASAYRLALDNAALLGQDRYRILYFEDLVGDPENTLKGIADWLGIRYSESLLRPSQMGTAETSRSSFGDNKAAIKNDVLKHDKRLESSTSKLERELLAYYTGLTAVGKHYGIAEIPRGNVQRLWWRTLLYERPRDYVQRLFSSRYNPSRMLESEIADQLVVRLPALARAGQAHLSGMV